MPAQLIVIERGEMGPAVHVGGIPGQCPTGSSPMTTRGIAVITGFIASERNGLPTTLGRNGSDFSASIVGALLDAEKITIWTDVDGVMSADPNRVPEAAIISALSYSEAMELAYFRRQGHSPADDVAGRAARHSRSGSATRSTRRCPVP